MRYSGCGTSQQSTRGHEISKDDIRIDRIIVWVVGGGDHAALWVFRALHMPIECTEEGSR